MSLNQLFNQNARIHLLPNVLSAWMAQLPSPLEPKQRSQDVPIPRTRNVQIVWSKMKAWSKTESTSHSTPSSNRCSRNVLKVILKAKNARIVLFLKIRDIPSIKIAKIIHLIQQVLVKDVSHRLLYSKDNISVMLIMSRSWISLSLIKWSIFGACKDV